MAGIISSPKPVICSLCPHHCCLKEGQHGNCSARGNINGKITPLFYGNLCSCHIDPIEKKPFFHVLPTAQVLSVASAGCNLHCSFCQNWSISQEIPDKSHTTRLTPENAINLAIEHSCPAIAYTYSEPLVSYEYTYNTSVIAHKKGLLNLLVTAGYIEQRPLKELCPLIDGANVDLKGITDTFYQTMTRATLKPVLESIITLKKEGVWVEITNLLIPTKNDNDKDIRALAHWVKDNCGADTPLHFSRFWPMHKTMDLKTTPPETLKRARLIAQAEGLHFVYTGNLPGDAGENTSCPSCHELLIERHGYQILQNKAPQGKCHNCGTSLPGIWK